MTLRRCLPGLVVLVLAALVILAWRIVPRTALPRHPPPRDASPLMPAIATAGVAQCAGRSCHGSLEPSHDHASWRMEYSLWTVYDPHARAFDTLRSDASRRMARRLGIHDGNAHEAPQCLVCHVGPAAAAPANGVHDATMVRERTFGIACAACHGCPDRWLDAHTRDGWSAKDAAAKQREYGLTNLNDPVVLVRTCAACHLGGPPGDGAIARDVNHDLIAAGHPALEFDAVALLARLPMHAKPRPRKTVQLAQLAPVATAEVALALLQYRAGSPATPWPEFAEYRCASCHHDLVEPSRRLAAEHRRPGSMVWETRYYLGLPSLPTLAELQRTLETQTLARHEVQSRAAALAEELRPLLDRAATLR
ncbi:MAG: cytochrome c family protein [Gemmataceae bacterium]|nr:cytochrome c family protein [Gemmataceae bacterium]